MLFYCNSKIYFDFSYNRILLASISASYMYKAQHPKARFRGIIVFVLIELIHYEDLFVLIIFSIYTKISKNTAIANDSISKLCKSLRKNDERVTKYCSNTSNS